MSLYSIFCDGASRVVYNATLFHAGIACNGGVFWGKVCVPPCSSEVSLPFSHLYMSFDSCFPTYSNRAALHLYEDSLGFK